MGRWEMRTKIWFGNPKGRDRSKYEELDGEIVLKRNLKNKDFEGVQWVGLSQGWDQWRAVVNMATNLRAL
jgi:hypothetical protein